MLYLSSALSKITARLFVNDCCPLLKRTFTASLCLSLERTLVGGRRCRSNVVVVSGRRFRPNFGPSGIHVFLPYSNHRNSRYEERESVVDAANKFPSCWCCGISVARSHVLTADKRIHV